MTPWGALDGLTAFAPRTGPFPQRGFIEAWWRHHPSGEPLVAAAEGAALALVTGKGVARFPGDADLADYHSPLGADPAEACLAAVRAVPTGTRFDLDSLPLEAAELLMKHFAAGGVSLLMAPHDATMLLELPADPAVYVDGLDGKQRHELRRKRRRFAAEAGEPRLDRASDHVDWFIATHRRAAGAKGGFMTDDMAEFFTDLTREAGGVVDVLQDGAGAPVAAAFGFEDADTYYLYNSAYDPDRAGLSPGIVLTTALIESAISRGKARFDFLKGGEDYKVRLGAVPRQLFRLEGVK